MTATERQVFAGVILLAAVLGYWIFLRFAALITSPWYFVPLMALAAACFDLAIRLPAGPRWLRTAVGAVLIGTVGWSIPFAVRDLNCRYSNMDLAVSRLSREMSAQDYVVVVPWHLGISFNHYYHGPTAWDSLPPVADHSTYRWDLLPVTQAGMAEATQPVLDRMTSTLQAGHRVWVVGWMRIPDPGRKASTPEGRLLAEHSRRFEAVDLKIEGQTSDYENVLLLEAEGWKP